MNLQKYNFLLSTNMETGSAGQLNLVGSRETFFWPNFNWKRIPRVKRSFKHCN